MLGNKSKYNFRSTQILFRPWSIRTFLIYSSGIFSEVSKHKGHIAMNQNEPTASAVTITCCLSTEHGFFEFLPSKRAKTIELQAEPN